MFIPTGEYCYEFVEIINEENKLVKTVKFCDFYKLTRDIDMNRICICTKINGVVINCCKLCNKDGE